MTDAELIARLRDAPADGLGTENLCLEAADRIEALLNLNEALVELMDDRDAKLAKAVEALGRAKASIENGGGGGVIDVVWLDGPCPETLCDFIDAILAEIKGESQDGMV